VIGLARPAMVLGANRAGVRDQAHGLPAGPVKLSLPGVLDQLGPINEPARTHQNWPRPR